MQIMRSDRESSVGALLLQSTFLYSESYHDFEAIRSRAASRPAAPRFPAPRPQGFITTSPARVQPGDALSINLWVGHNLAPLLRRYQQGRLQNGTSHSPGDLFLFIWALRGA